MSNFEAVVRLVKPLKWVIKASVTPVTLAESEETPACPASVFNSVRRASVAATVPKTTVIVSLLPVPVKRKPFPTP